MNEYQVATPLPPSTSFSSEVSGKGIPNTISTLLWNLVTPEGSGRYPISTSWPPELKGRFTLSLSETRIPSDPDHPRSFDPTSFRTNRSVIDSPIACYAQVQTSRTLPQRSASLPTSFSKTEATLQINKMDVSLPKENPFPSLNASTSGESLHRTPIVPPPNRTIPSVTSKAFQATPGIFPSTEHKDQLSDIPHQGPCGAYPQAILQGVLPDVIDPDAQNERGDPDDDTPMEIENGTGMATQSKVSHVASQYFQSIPSEGTDEPLDSDPVGAFLSSVSPQLSDILGQRASHFDILLICLALMKLDLQSQEEEKLARRVERSMQLQYLEKEVLNFKSQAKSLLFAHVGAGVLGVVGGFLPILGLMKGDSILNGLSGVFSSLSGKKSKDVFEGLSKMMQSISETQKASGQIFGTFAEADRTRWNRFGDIHARDQEERTRALEQLQEKFRGMERFLLELLQMRHDITSQLYR